MGVDFFPCDNCGETICDAGDYWQCDNENCWKTLCTRCASKLVNAVDVENEEGEEICPFCEGEIATDTDLLGFALLKLKMTREELLAEMKLETP